MPRPVVGLWLTTLVWVAVGGGLWAYHDHQLKNGREIELKTVPVDPRDILRGDYVVLRYEISTVERRADTSQFWGFRVNRPVFVSLRTEAGSWTVSEVGYDPPAEGLFLRGRVRSKTEERLEVAYGIESFFVPEGEGVRYEEARNRERLWAILSVSPHGVAYLKRLEIR